MKLSGEQLESLYTTMVRIRRFDERTAELFNQGVVKGTAHSYVGEEAVAAGACAALREDDYIVGTHRGHGHCLAKGARVDRMIAELMGRQDGYCRGLGGSMHIAALDLNILGCNGIVAAGLPIGTGAALAARLKHTDRVVIAFFGDGASSQGTVHESLNLAAVWRLPIVFLCENNQYALSTSSKRTVAGESIRARRRLRDPRRARGRQRRARRLRGREDGGGAGARGGGPDAGGGAHLPVGRPLDARQPARLPDEERGARVDRARSGRALRPPARRRPSRDAHAAQGAGGDGRGRSGPGR